MTPEEVLKLVVTALSGGLVGGVVGALLTNWLVIRRDRSNRPRVLRGSLQTVIESLDLTKDEDLLAFHKATMPGILNECARACPDIKRQKLPQFNSTRVAFCRLGEADIAKTDTSKFDELGLAAFVPDYAKGRKDMRDLLKKLLDCVEK
jgi:hypothetical protein